MRDDPRNQPHGDATPEQARIEMHLRAFRAHWEACRKGADVPRRADIDPRRIEPLLSNTFIAERIAPGAIRLRIAGMHLSDLMGMDVRGMPLCSFIAPACRDEFARHLVDLFDQPAILRFGLHSRGGLGCPALSGTLLMLPLRSDLGDISRALGCLVTRGQISRPVRRFALTSAEILPLGIPNTHTPFSVIAGTAARPRSPERGRAHLRVVK